MKKNYESPSLELIKLNRNLSLLEYFSGVGDVEQFEDGGELEGVEGQN